MKPVVKELEVLPGIVYTKADVSRRHASQKSHTLEHADRSIIIYLLRLGFHEKRIAALFDVNQGRIAEVSREAKRMHRL